MAKKAKKDLTLEEKLQNALVADWEQPYALPENWVWSYLGKCFEWGSGGTPSRKNIGYFQGNIPWVKTGELGKSYIFDTEEKITEEAVKNSSAKLYPINTVIIAMYGATIGKVAVLGIPATTNQACACAKPGTINHNFLYFYIVLKKSDLIELGKGGAQPNISQDIIKQVPFPLPPLAEQERIVQRIESLFAKLDTAKELLEEALESFESRKSALLHQAFTGELTKAWREKNAPLKNTFLPQMQNYAEKQSNKDKKFIIDFLHQSVNHKKIPSWVLCKIGAIGIIGNGSTPSRKSIDYWNGHIPWVSSGEVKNNTIYRTKELITKLGYENSSVKILPIGTVLIAMIGEGKTRGQSAILAIEATTNQNIAHIRLEHNLVDPKFLCYWFQKSYLENREVGNGSGQQALNCQKVRELPFILPTLPEQEEIVRILAAQLHKEEEAKAHITHSLEHIEHMKKAILARAFRGELGTNNPEDGHALDLLKEILSQERPAPKEKKPSKKFALPKELTKELAISALEKIIYESIAEKQELSIQDILTFDKDSLKIIQSLDRMEKMHIITKLSDTKYTIKD